MFISYSRRDLEFADQLAAVPDWMGFHCIIDRVSMDPAVPWKARLSKLILESDIVVFLLSPDSAESDICGWETEEAARRGKRIVPVLYRSLQRRQPPARLRELNHIYFFNRENAAGSGFGAGQVKLVAALSVDVEWLREYSWLEERASRWHQEGRASDLLLRDSDLAGSKTWRDRRPADAPDLTALRRAFIASSEGEEAARSSAERKRLEEMAAAQAERLQRSRHASMRSIARPRRAGLVPVRARS